MDNKQRPAGTGGLNLSAGAQRFTPGGHGRGVAGNVVAGGMVPGSVVAGRGFGRGRGYSALRGGRGSSSHVQYYGAGGAGRGRSVPLRGGVPGRPEDPPHSFGRGGGRGRGGVFPPRRRRSPGRPPVQRAYAIDCEMVEVVSSAQASMYGQAAVAHRAVVSIGVVDESMEVILYARVRKPATATVVNDTFARTKGGLTADWSKGLSIFSARDLLQRLVQEGALIVGWQIDSDLKALGMERTIPPEQVVDLTNHFQTTNGHKCKLQEAYSTVFRRAFSAHNAGDDAKVTMELYHYWKEAARSQTVKIDLSFYAVTWHSFGALTELKLSRGDVLWKFLRPVTNDREVVLEDDDGKNAYKLRFRQREDRDAYLHVVQRRLKAEQINPVGAAVRLEGSRGTELNFRYFRSHKYEIKR